MAKSSAEYFEERYGCHPKQAQGHQRKAEYFRLMDFSESRGYDKNAYGGYSFASGCFKGLWGEWPPNGWLDEWNGKGGAGNKCPTCNGTGRLETGSCDTNEAVRSDAQRSMDGQPEWKSPPSCLRPPNDVAGEVEGPPPMTDEDADGLY